MGVEYLYLGDIGDNYEERKRLTVYRIREPDVRAGGYTSRSSGGVDRRVIPEADYDTLTLRGGTFVDFFPLLSLACPGEA